MEETAKERIRFNTEIIKILALLFAGTGGGTVSLIINGVEKASEGIFIGFGIILTVLSLIVGIFVYRTTLKLLRNE